MTNFTNQLSGHLDKVIGAKDMNNQGKVDYVFSFIDSVITNNGKPEHAATSVLDAASELVNSKLSGDGHQVLRNEIHQQLRDRKNTFVTGSKQDLAQRVANQVKPLKAAAAVLEDQAQASLVSSEGYDLKEAQNFYFHGLSQVEKQVSEHDGDEASKSQLNDQLIEELSKDTVEKYGKEHALSLVSSLQEKIIPVEIHARQAQSEYKLPVLDLENNEELKNLVEAFNSGEDNLTLDQKNEVIDLASDIFDGKDVQLEYHALSTEQKAYMEHLRQGADKAGSAINGLEGILGKLGNKVPELLMPAIIGAVVGYLMGGMEIVGGLGAVVVSFLGMNLEATEASSEKKAPPERILNLSAGKIQTENSKPEERIAA